MFNRKYFLFILLVVVFLSFNLYLNYQTKHALATKSLLEYSLKDLKKYIDFDLYRLQIHQSGLKQVINPHNYNYIINPGNNVCAVDRHNITLVALVTSSAKNFERRLAIRNTWSNRSLFPRLRTVFIIGKSNDQDVNKRLHIESQFFGDIVQEDFSDTYLNLTLKTVMAMKWSADYCSNSKFLLKVDDDVIVNSFYIIEYLEAFETSFNNTLLCLHHTKAKVIRNQTDKFYVTKAAFKNDYFQPYCGGGAYMFTSDLASSFYKQSLYTKPFVFEDVYVGMLAAGLRTNFINLRKNYCWKKVFCDEALQSAVNSTYFFYVNGTRDLYRGWSLVSKNVFSKLF